MNTQINAILTIAYRDIIKFTRDRGRIIATFVFPFVFIGILGKSLQTNLSSQVGFDFLSFTFTGVLAQTLFQSTASGIISLIEDRENDFSQEIFVSPISRYSIVLGKIAGESSVALLQGIGVILFGLISGISMTPYQVLLLIPVSIVACLLGGAFGLIIMANLHSQRAANQIFPFLILPQFFIAGVFTPITNLPPYLFVISRLAPMTYAVDLVRSVFYAGQPSYDLIVLYPAWVNLTIISAIFTGFVVIGTWIFVRNERNR